MATQKPISTISYNSEEFLKSKLKKWYDAHIIQAYQYIKHIGEDGDKDHIHLRIEPNKKLDPMDLQTELREFTTDSVKPLGCRPFRPSKEEDWILYACHDETYLKIKYGGGEKGEKIPYFWDEIKVNEFYDIEIAYIRAKAYMEHTTVNVATKLRNGENALNLILQGENPHTVNALMQAIKQNDYNRLNTDYQNLKNRLELITLALEQIGLVIKDDFEKGTLKVVNKDLQP